MEEEEDDWKEIEDEDIGEDTLRNVVSNQALKWIIVGGKGGVGKTLCCCSLAVLLSRRRPSVLLVSADVSTAFGQEFLERPIQVNGFTNLYAIGTSPSTLGHTEPSNVLEELFFSVPDMDEALSYSVLGIVVDMWAFSVVVLDTSATSGPLPKAIADSYSRLVTFRNSMGPLQGFVVHMFGVSGNTLDQFLVNLQLTMESLERLTDQLRHDGVTSFVLVTLADLSGPPSVEQLVAQLRRFAPDILHNIVVNKMFPDFPCPLCSAFYSKQAEIINTLKSLFKSYNIIKLPLLPKEPRSPQEIDNFAQYLIEPYGRKQILY